MRSNKELQLLRDTAKISRKKLVSKVIIGQGEVFTYEEGKLIDYVNTPIINTFNDCIEVDVYE